MSEAPIDVSELPRGPASVATKVADPWSARWVAAETDDTKSYGVALEHPDGRWGWATWRQGKYTGAVIFRHRGSILPRLLNATELKAEVAG